MENEFNKVMVQLKERDTAKQMSDEELQNLRTAINKEMIRRKVIKHIQKLANLLK